MNTVHKFPVSQLPAKLRGNFKDDQLVTVTVESEDVALPSLTDAQFDSLFAESYAQKERGEGTVCKTPDDVDAYFDALRARVDAKYQNA